LAPSSRLSPVKWKRGLTNNSRIDNLISLIRHMQEKSTNSTRFFLQRSKARLKIDKNTLPIAKLRI